MQAKPHTSLVTALVGVVLTLAVAAPPRPQPSSPPSRTPCPPSPAR